MFFEENVLALFIVNTQQKTNLTPRRIAYVVFSRSSVALDFIEPLLKEFLKFVPYLVRYVR